MGKILFALALVSVLCGCKKNAEENALAHAQKCLDEVPLSNPGAASGCMTYIQDYNDQQADILKCSILDTAGGLTEDKIVSAYNLIKNTNSNQAAALMSVLALDNPDVNSGYTMATQADTYCQESGVPGMMYLSSLIVAGTYMRKTMDSLTITFPSPTDPNFNADATTAVNQLVQQCGGASPPASCQTDIAALASSVTTVATAYCGTDGADQTVCNQVNSAITQAGGNSADVGQALFCYLNHKTFDPGSGGCI